MGMPNVVVAKPVETPDILKNPLRAGSVEKTYPNLSERPLLKIGYNQL